MEWHNVNQYHTNMKRNYFFTMLAAVDAIVKGLKNRGYELVTVSELIRRGRAAAGHAPSMPAAPAVPDSSPLVVPAIVAPAEPVPAPAETVAGM